MKVKVRIEGIAPLLQHRFPDVGEVEKKSKKRTGAPDYDKDVENALYTLPDGTIYQPSTHIEGALVKAAVNFKIAGKRGKTYKDLVKSSIFVSPEAIVHKKQEYVIDKRAVVVPSTRGRIIRARPRFDKWVLNFDMDINDEQMPIEVANEILEYAGRYVGIGDFRPKFGRFMVTKFKEVKSR